MQLFKTFLDRMIWKCYKNMMYLINSMINYRETGIRANTNECSRIGWGRKASNLKSVGLISRMGNVRRWPGTCCPCATKGTHDRHMMLTACRNSSYTSQYHSVSKTVSFGNRTEAVKENNM